MLLYEMTEDGAYCSLFMQIRNLLCIDYEIGMCINSKFMRWWMFVVNRTPQIHVLAIRFLAETFILFVGLPN